MTRLFDEISGGLREAIVHAKGGKTGLGIHEFRAPDRRRLSTAQPLSVQRPRSTDS